jgi:hypothetical protein
MDAKKPFGVWKEVVVNAGVGDNDKMKKIRVNVGGGITRKRMSDNDRVACEKYSGRGCNVMEDDEIETLLPSERNAYDEIVVRDEDR